MQPEVVFFYGPPFSGKTLFYVHHFSQTHEWISPRELFEADPSLSLRAVILKVVKVINKGKSVVVDDENSSKKNRKSYLNILKNKVPQSITYRVVDFHVSSSYGLFLCQWAREWDLAHQFECLSSGAPLKETSKDVEHWFEKMIEPPNEEEDFKKIDKVEIQLICNTPFKFVVPALFLQWEGLFQSEEDAQSSVQEAVVDVLKRWSHSNPCGRVIVLKLSEKQPCKDGSCDCIDVMKGVLGELVIQAAIPVFFVHLRAFLWKFHRPPNPGLFAWLQRLHSIDFSNRATFCVCSSDTHQKAASAAGIKCIKANKLLHSPQMINAVYCGLPAQVPECVSEAKLAWFGPQSRPAAFVPLYHRAVTSRDPSNGHDMTPHCDLVATDNIVHGVCFKDFATLDSFNSRYQHFAVTTEPASKDIFNFKVCESSGRIACAREGQRNAKSNTSSSGVSVTSKVQLKSTDKSSVSSKVNQESSETTASPLSSGLAAKRLTRDDIESLAFSAGHFRRGEGCVKLIQNVTSVIEQDGLLFKANCLGSQGQLYDVSALLSQGGIVRAGCSCADPASKLGKCKHAVGLLLWCKNEKNMKDINKPSIHLDKSNIGHKTETVAKVKKEEMCDDSANNKRGEVPSQLGKGKSLPKWISSPTQSTVSDGDGGKRTGEQGSPGKLRHKRMKTKKITENTFYCLSPEELLQTAKEILEENRLSLSDHEPHKTDQSRRQSTEDKECSAKPSISAAKQPLQGNSTRGSLTPPIESKVLIKETFIDETHPETPSHDTNVVSVVPESATTVTEEFHPKENKPGHSDIEQRTRRDLTDNTEERGKRDTTSILDDFI